MGWRQRRRFFFLSIFLIVILLFSVVIYFKNRKPAPLCANNRQDPGEKGIDCGGPCPPCGLEFLKPLKIYPVQILIYADNSFDLIGLIENPNQNLALKSLKYRFLIYDKENNLRLKTPFEETILDSSEKRYLVKINTKEPEFEIGKAILEINDPQKYDWIERDFSKLPLKYFNEKIFVKNDRWYFSFSLFNDSYRDLNDVEIIIFIYNNDKLIGVSKSLHSFKSQETKNITLPLPNMLLKPTGYEIYLQKQNF